MRICLKHKSTQKTQMRWKMRGSCSQDKLSATEPYMSLNWRRKPEKETPKAQGENANPPCSGGGNQNPNHESVK